jgi:hypothetical protein
LPIVGRSLGVVSRCVAPALPIPLTVRRLADSQARVKAFHLTGEAAGQESESANSRSALMQRHLVPLVVSLSLLFSAFAATQDSSYTFTTIDVPHCYSANGIKIA